METKKLLTAIAIISVGLIAGCQKDNFLEVNGVCPVVVSTSPMDLTTGIRLDKIITVIFNEKMNPATFTTSSITIQETTPKAAVISGAEKAASQVTALVAGTITYSGITATFTPTSALIPNTNYTGRVKTSVKDLMGNALQVEYVWTFTTSATPSVSLTDPANSATNVAFNKVISATFSMPMDSLTINASTFTIKQAATSVAGTISYSGSTVTFTPAVALIPNTVYTCTITAGTLNKAGIPLANDYVWTFTTVATAPIVISTDPPINATNVVLNKVILANFSVPMDPATLTTTTFTLKQGTTSIAGTVAYSGTTASFTPAVALAPNVVYTGTITTGAKNILGTPLANDYVWTFTTGTFQAPIVSSTDPINNATGVGINKVVAATFSVPMDASTLTTATVTLKQGNTLIAGVVTYNSSISTAYFTPSIALIPNTIYTGTVTTGAKNVLGTPLTNNYVWTFTTALMSPTIIATDPLINETGVVLNKVVSATFSVPMNPTTITGTTFSLKQGTNSVAGTVSYNGSIATFIPSVALSPSTVYTATITTGAKNVSGTPLIGNYVWSFTTGTFSAPTVISTDPANNGTNVSLLKVVSATFSGPMDATSFTTATFVLKQGTTSIIGTVSYSGSIATAYFTPNVALLPNTVYTGTITTGTKNVLGTPLANDYVWNFTTAAPLGPLAPDLKTSGRFGILAGVGVSNNAGFSVINNLDVGISPGVRSSVTGFPPAIVVNGAIYASDDGGAVAAMLTQAKQDLTDAYLFAEGAVSPAPATVSGDQGGKTLAPGIYKSTSTLLIQSGDLTLDAQGDVNAVWIFQVAAGFTTVGGAGGNIILSGGAQAKNVYWQVGSSATIGDFTSFKGNILALTSITMNSGATAEGRMLARNGSIIMTSTNTINKP